MRLIDNRIGNVIKNHSLTPIGRGRETDSAHFIINDLFLLAQSALTTSLVSGDSA